MATPEQAKQFIADVAPMAHQFFCDHKISAALIIAQGILESGYGQYAPGNNLFGIKADASWHGAVISEQTKEYINGQWETVTATFRAYPSKGDSLVDHGKFLLENSRYHNLIGAPWQQAVELIHQDGYATDPTYTQQLRALITQWDLEQYDVANRYEVIVQAFSNEESAGKVCEAIKLLGFHAEVKTL